MVRDSLGIGLSSQRSARRSAITFALLHVREGAVGVPAWVRLFVFECRGTRFREQCTRVIARVRCDARLAFLIEMAVVIQRRDIAEMNASDGADSAASERFEGRRDQLAAGAKRLPNPFSEEIAESFPAQAAPSSCAGEDGARCEYDMDFMSADEARSE